MKKQILLMLVLVFVMVSMSVAGEPIGVFANYNTNCIQFIDPLTQTVSPPWLSSRLGNLGGGLYDMVITSDGKTAIVSNFGDSKLFYINISKGFDVSPTKIPFRTKLPFFAEDMALTPDDKYVLVTDGGFTPRIAVVNVTTHELEYVANPGNKYSNAVAVSPDGKTVLTADYFAGKVHMWSLLADGSLVFVKSRTVLPAYPVNIIISPNGKTAIVVSANTYNAPTFLAYDLILLGLVPLPTRGGQSCVFSRDGTKAYYLSNPWNRPTQVHVLNVTALGGVSYSGISITVSPKRGSSKFFGVDTIAIDPSGKYLYVTNPTVSGGVRLVSIINLQTNKWENNLIAKGIPTGIAFANIAGPNVPPLSK